MKKILFIAIFCLSFTSQVFAEVYLSAKAGYFIGHSTFEGGSSFDVSGLKGIFSLGYNLNFSSVNLRMEVEYNIADEVSGNESLSNNHYLDMDYQSHSAFFNIYLDFNANGVVMPYIGVGAGASYLLGTYNYKSGNYFNGRQISSENFLSPSIQGVLGLFFKLHKNIGIDLGYKVHKGFSDSYFEGDFNHNAFLGLRFSFL